jgi:hypothetical protein
MMDAVPDKEIKRRKAGNSMPVRTWYVLSSNTRRPLKWWTGNRTWTAHLISIPSHSLSFLFYVPVQNIMRDSESSHHPRQ